MRSTACGLAAACLIVVGPLTQPLFAADAGMPQSRLPTVTAPLEAPLPQVSNPVAIEQQAKSDAMAKAAQPVTPASTTEAPTAPLPAAPASASIAGPTPRPKPKLPDITLAIDIDLTRQQMTLTEHGKVAGSWPISSGRDGYRSPTGTFRPLWTAKMWYSKKYDNAPMPHAVFFSGGVAMHATYATGMLGRPASHGCIRQSPANAATTYRLVEKHGFQHTRIVVHGVPRDAEPKVARREVPRLDRGGARPTFASAQGTNRGVRPQQSSVPMRRVILVDGDGNRRIGMVAANDPRLQAYYQRRSAY